MKTEYSKDIKNLDQDLKMILKEVNPFFTEEYNSFPENFKEKINLEKWKKIKFHYLLFADKNVSKDSINIIVNELKNSQLIKVYQVYATKETKYTEFNNLKTIKL